MKTLTIPNEVLIPQIATLIKEGRNVTFLVKGFSMRPFLENARDKVILSPVRKDIEAGDVVLAEVGTRRYVLHRVLRRRGNELTLLGDGNVRGTEQCRIADVVGIATGFYRKQRQTPDLVSGLKWRTYSLIWTHTRFMRRYALALHRRLFKLNTQSL